MDSNELRKLAEALRAEAERVKVARDQKCAQIFVAAKGLDILKRKLTSHA